MPKYVLFALGACLFYAIENVILDKYLKGVSHYLLMAMSSVLPILIAAIYLAWQKHNGTLEGLPTTRLEVVCIAICSVLTALAAFCFYSAYTSGGNAHTIPILVVSLPIFAGITKCVIERSWPEPKHVLALVLVSVAVWLVSR